MKYLSDNLLNFIVRRSRVIIILKNFCFFSIKITLVRISMAVYNFIHKHLCHEWKHIEDILRWYRSPGTQITKISSVFLTARCVVFQCFISSRISGLYSLVNSGKLNFTEFNTNVTCGLVSKLVLHDRANGVMISSRKIWPANRSHAPVIDVKSLITPRLARRIELCIEQSVENWRKGP